MSSPWLIRAGDGARDGFDLVVSPATTPLRHAGLRTVTLPPGTGVDLDLAGVEAIVVPLQGAAVVTVGGEDLALRGRSDVFAAATDVAYLPPGTARLASGRGGCFAVCTAVVDPAGPLPAATVLRAEDVPVERRGAGQASRLVRNLGTEDVLAAQVIIACEVVTPAGNWSSYPAHKHDETTAHETALEEIYHYRIAPGPHGEPGSAFHRTSASPGHQIDETVEVHDRDTVLVPYGWHGPVVAAPGHDLYQLNVMAGPGPERRWLISDHPDQAWVRDTWADVPVDPRLADGRYGTRSTSAARPAGGS